MNVNAGSGLADNHMGLDIPVGFGVILEGEPVAKENFAKLTVHQKNDLIRYMQLARTGQESEERVVNAIQILKNDQSYI